MPVDGQQQLVTGRVEVVGQVVHRPPVGEHGPLDLDDVGPVPVPATAHLAEHDREHRPSDRRRRVDGEVPVADGAPHGRPHERRVLREVAVGDPAPVRRHLGDHRPADLAGREHRGPLVRDEVEHLAEQVVGADVAGLQRGPVPAGDDGERLGVPAEERVGREGEVAGGRRPDGVALAAGSGGRGHDLRPRHRPQLLDGELAGRDGTVGRDRAVSAEEGDTSAVPEADLLDAPAEAVDRQAAPRHLDVAVDDDRVTVRGPHGNEGPARQRHDAGSGDGGVHDIG